MKVKPYSQNDRALPMKVAAYYNKEQINYEDRHIPTIGDEEVLIRMEYCGLCGTDIHKVIDETVPPETVLGHEVSGEIVKTGAKVKDYKVGDRVFVAHHVPCFTCHYCKRGSFSLCAQFKQTNLDPGGFSEYIRVPALHVKHTMGLLPNGMSYEQGALVEPIACCLHGFELIDTHPGDTIFIMGAGQIGLLQVQIARALYASNIIVSDINPFRLDKALEFGADEAINSQKENVAEKVLELTNGRGADIIIISASISSLLPEALECVARGGTVLVFAPFKDTEVAIPAAKFFKDEIKVIGSYSSNPYNYEKAVYMLKNKVFDVERMITHRFPLAELDKAIATAHNPTASVLKVLITP
ncbi:MULTISPECIES: alcohol dehydrogenase catalytic domain-containing protein [unclassified Niallia]|uniref:alcohol dehydrogenase catalytic domain-containing protein n=1 Tax=unclassified Niallia TaxID=2837522 RepID=UPI001EDA27BC|nr:MULTISPECIES: alcohol dehydrogenase catalytic domain-containing protein [unclassified Niallia]MDL0437365.1 alcohol dehydrogenase catalytic domain-containing protein [Niallia sp. SS-2023]UPO86032.1 alcohol dehydrogenase catalytic domain-containing protein [Niallia sp. Man26]